jgi:branched-chain amino acid transport system permease protein
METRPTTIAAAFGIAIFEQSVFWALDDTSLVNVALLLVIVVAMLTQRGKLARTEEGSQSTWAANEEVRTIPAELANFPPVRRTIRRAAVFGLIALLAYPFVASPSQTNLGSIYAIYGIIAISIAILTGWGGQISLGQFAFVAVGGAVGASITAKLGWHFLIALPIASVIGAGVAILLGLPALRIKGLFLAVTTLAFAVAVSTVVLNPRYFGWLLPGSNVKRPVFVLINTEDERA